VTCSTVSLNAHSVLYSTMTFFGIPFVACSIPEGDDKLGAVMDLGETQNRNLPVNARCVQYNNILWCTLPLQHPGGRRQVRGSDGPWGDAVQEPGRAGDAGDSGSTCSAHYPERMYRLYFVHVPDIFWGLWKAVRPLLNQRIRQKVSTSTLVLYILHCTYSGVL